MQYYPGRGAKHLHVLSVYHYDEARRLEMMYMCAWRAPAPSPWRAPGGTFADVTNSRTAERGEKNVFSSYPLTMVWQDWEPQAVANLWGNFPKTFAYLSVKMAPALAPLIRTTNLLERFHQEVRRKQRDIGMFHSEQGCEVLWYLLAMRETSKQRAALQSRL